MYVCMYARTHARTHANCSYKLTSWNHSSRFFLIGSASSLISSSYISHAFNMFSWIIWWTWFFYHTSLFNTKYTMKCTCDRCMCAMYACVWCLCDICMWYTHVCVGYFALLFSTLFPWKRVWTWSQADSQQAAAQHPPFLLLPHSEVTSQHIAIPSFYLGAGIYMLIFMLCKLFYPLSHVCTPQ